MSLAKNKFVLTATAMELVMYLGNDFIASKSLQKEKITTPGYISSVKRSLLKANQEVLLYESEEPQFWVVNLSGHLHLESCKVSH